MIKFIQNGDMFSSLAEALVNPCNCVGKAGKGLSLEFKQLFPQYYRTYQYLCRNGHMEVGKVAISLSGAKSPRYIVSFPTKKHWKNPSQLQWIIDGLKDLRQVLLTDLHVDSIAIPPLGCGNGRLNYKDVRPIILQELGDLDLYVEVYEPN